MDTGFIKAYTHLITNDCNTTNFQEAVQLNADIPVMALPRTNAWMSWVPAMNKNIPIINSSS
jgi:hypothetical protein